MPGLATALAALLRRPARACVVLACVWAALLIATLASASVGVQAKTRVWAFEHAAALNVSPVASATARTHLAFPPAQSQHALGSPHAAKGAATFGSKTAGAAERVLNLGGGVRVGAATFHSRIKPAILKAAGKFSGRVGRNPDIKVVGGKIHLQGVGPFKGRTVQTDLRASDFFGID